MGKFLKLTIGSSILLVSLSVSYYYLSFLPNLEKQRDVQKQMDVLDAQNAKSQRAISLNRCLMNADFDANNSWNSNCRTFGTDTKNDGCLLPAYNANSVNDFRKELKDDCFKQYPQ